MRSRWTLGLAVVAALSGSSSAAAAPGDVVSSFAAPGDSPSGLGWDGSSLWIANLRTAGGGGTDRVSRHDPVTGAMLSFFDMPAGDVYHGLAFEPGGDVWTDDLYSAIVRLSPTGVERTRFSAPGMTYGIAFVGGGRLLVPVWPSRVLTEIDLTGTVQRTVPISTFDAMYGGSAWDGTTLWLVGTSDNVYRINAATGGSTATFRAPGSGTEGIAWDGACLWLSDTATDTIYRVDHGQADLPSCPPAAAVDAGLADGGAVDAGTDGGGAGIADAGLGADAGGADSGPIASDTGGTDAGPVPSDTGATDAGAIGSDVGPAPFDAGPRDAGALAPPPSGGCGCAAGAPRGAAGGVAIMAAGAWAWLTGGDTRRRRR